MINYVGRRVESLKDGPTKDKECVLPYFSAEQVKSFRSVFGFLNDKDRDILFLIFVSQKKQNDVQTILGRSQPSLCYDIKRIRRRLKFIFYLHSVFDDFVLFIQEQNNDNSINGDNARFSSVDLEIMTLMFYTSSFTIASTMMGISSVRVRYTYNKCLRKVWDMGRYDIYEILNIVRRDLNIVRRRCRGEKEARIPIMA